MVRYFRHVNFIINNYSLMKQKQCQSQRRLHFHDSNKIRYVNGYNSKRRCTLHRNIDTGKYVVAIAPYSVATNVS